MIVGSKIEYKASSYYDDEEDYKEMKSLVPKYMVATREKGKDLHYMV